MYVCMYVCMHGMRGMHRMQSYAWYSWYGMVDGMVCMYVYFQTFSVKNHFSERLDSNAMKNARKHAPRESKHELGSNNANMERQWFQQQMI